MPHSRLVRCLAIACAFLFSLPSRAAEGTEAAPYEDNPFLKLDWKQGPVKGDLKGRADIAVPEGFRFLEDKDASKVMVLMGNRSNGEEMGFLTHEEDGWAVVFEFSDTGYVKDDDKNELDADALLKAIREGNKAGNEYRKQNGIAPINIIGWHVKPTYNDQTKNLEWSILAESQGNQFVNYNVRLLGRRGVTEATLMEDYSKVDATLPAFREVLKGFQYATGESYAEFRQGDTVAQYGLGALVLGGAAAAGYKLGFFAMIGAFLKKGWKLVVLVVVGAAAAMKKLFFGGARRPMDGSGGNS